MPRVWWRRSRSRPAVADAMTTTAKLAHDRECEQRGRTYWTDCQCEARQAATAKAIEAWVADCDESGGA